MLEVLERVNSFVWGAPALILILGVGLYLTIRTGFAQFTLLPKALRVFLRQFSVRNDTDGVSPYRALCTALAATVGTGNLAGVAGAIAIGGPGAIFWMWICALFGMVTKFAEATLAIRYRQKNIVGEFVGGPMYMIQNGLSKKWRPMALIYCFFGIVACFGVGNATQINTVISGINSAAGFFGMHESELGNLLIGAALSILITVLLLGGAKRIGAAAEMLVPWASVFYLVLGLIVLVINDDRILPVFAAIIEGAFCPKAVTGGILGSAFTALRTGASRGVFTNEAGMGTASIAHAGAQVNHPVEQGLMGIIEVFLDTVVICTITALVILCGGVSVPYGTDVGMNLTTAAFSTVFGQWISVPIALCLCCLAIATVLGWGLYGMRCAQYIFGEKSFKVFAFLQAATVILGSILNTGTVWMLSEVVNGLMAIPNLITLAMLTPELVRLTNDYKKETRKQRVSR